MLKKLLLMSVFSVASVRAYSTHGKRGCEPNLSQEQTEEGRVQTHRRRRNPLREVRHLRKFHDPISMFHPGVHVT